MSSSIIKIRNSPLPPCQHNQNFQINSNPYITQMTQIFRLYKYNFCIFFTCNSGKYTKIILIKSKYLCHLGNIWVTVNFKILIMMTWGEGEVSDFDYAWWHYGRGGFGGPLFLMMSSFCHKLRLKLVLISATRKQFYWQTLRFCYFY